MSRKISSDGATTSAKVFSILPIPLLGLMLAVLIYNKQIGAFVAVGGVASLGAYAWAVRRFVWSMIDEVTDYRRRDRLAIWAPGGGDREAASEECVWLDSRICDDDRQVARR